MQYKSKSQRCNKYRIQIKQLHIGTMLINKWQHEKGMRNKIKIAFKIIVPYDHGLSYMIDYIANHLGNCPICVNLHNRGIIPYDYYSYKMKAFFVIFFMIK